MEFLKKEVKEISELSNELFRSRNEKIEKCYSCKSRGHIAKHCRFRNMQTPKGNSTLYSTEAANPSSHGSENIKINADKKKFN